MSFVAQVKLTYTILRRTQNGVLTPDQASQAMRDLAEARGKDDHGVAGYAALVASQKLAADAARQAEIQRISGPSPNTAFWTEWREHDPNI
jgi:hypothetical protein